MEVHHPHHLHHKKKWKEYLLEFFMLFFAVALGFLVENQREHYVEETRGYVYAKRFLEDLKEDSIRIDRLQKSVQEKIDHILTITPHFTDTGNIRQAIDSFYYYGFWSYNVYGNIQFLPRFTRVEETLEELKAGNLRLIKSDSVVSNLMEYSRRNTGIKRLLDLWETRAEKIGQLHSEMFDKTYYLLHENDHPSTYPIKYRKINEENKYQLKVELLSFRVNMSAYLLNLNALMKVNVNLRKHLTAYINH